MSNRLGSVMSVAVLAFFVCLVYYELESWPLVALLGWLGLEALFPLDGIDRRRLLRQTLRRLRLW